MNRGGEGNVKTETEIGRTWPQVKNASSHQELEDKEWILLIAPPEAVQPS